MVWGSKVEVGGSVYTLSPRLAEQVDNITWTLDEVRLSAEGVRIESRIVVRWDKEVVIPSEFLKVGFQPIHWAGVLAVADDVGTAYRLSTRSVSMETPSRLWDGGAWTGDRLTQAYRDFWKPGVPPLAQRISLRLSSVIEVREGPEEAAKRVSLRAAGYDLALPQLRDL